MPSNKRIAVWMSEKKLQKMDWDEFESVCNNYGFELFKVNIHVYCLYVSNLHRVFFIFLAQFK